MNDPVEPVADIAIIGIGCLFPKADSPQRFWRNIHEGVDCISRPPESWTNGSPHGRMDEASDQKDNELGGYLHELATFQPEKYGIMPMAVDGAEPDQFLALRCAVEAWQDAGLLAMDGIRPRTGVILGRGLFINRGLVTWTSHGHAVEQFMELLRQLEPDRPEPDFELIRREIKRQLPPFTAATVPGLVNSVICGRIANRLNLGGPAFTVDAACASSLVAVDSAITELRSGRCDAVIAGGVQGTTPALIRMLFSQLGALSRSGCIAPLTQSADGMLVGEGCGMIVLRRREDAERDGNHIYALVRGTGVASDGRGQGLLAPRKEGQLSALERAYGGSRSLRRSIGMLEAHGTGTPVGDATEIESVATFFHDEHRQTPISIGSVKSMIGHLLPAAGSASLIKATLALYNRVLPPSLHAERPATALLEHEETLQLAQRAAPWVHGDSKQPRRAGVNAFGFGGINAHVVLEEYPRPTVEARRCEWPFELIMLHAQSQSDLAAKAIEIAAVLTANPNFRLVDLALTLAQPTGSQRLCLVASSIEDLTTKLARAAHLLGEPDRTQIQDRSGIFWYAQPLAQTGQVAAMFPGEGAQYVNMLRDLTMYFPEMTRQFDLADAGFLRLERPFRLSRLIFPYDKDAEAGEELLKTEAAVGSVIAAERALWAIMRGLGFAPQAIVGHSSGEFAALQASGTFLPADDEALVQLITDGARAAAEVAALGSDLSTVLTAIGGASREVVLAAIDQSEGHLEIAMDNCPHQIVVSGDESPTQRLVQSLQKKGSLCERLNWGRTYHTPRFRSAIEPLRKYFQTLSLHQAEIPLWSCATAAPFPQDQAGIVALALQQWCQTVRFQETTKAMHDAGVRVFVEIGPRSTLSNFVRDTLADKPHVAVSLDGNPRKHGLEMFLRGIAQLIAHGVQLDWITLLQQRGAIGCELSNTSAPPLPSALRIDLPKITVSEEVARQWQNAKSARSGSRAESSMPTDAASNRLVGTEPPPNTTAVVTHEEQFSPVVARSSSPPPSLSRQVVVARFDAVEQRSESQSECEQNQVYAEFQQTMRDYLAVQSRVMTEAFQTLALVSYPADVDLIAEYERGSVVDESSRGEPITDYEQAHEREGTQVNDSAPSQGLDDHFAGPARSLAQRVVPPLLQSILTHDPGRRLIAETEIQAEDHRFLTDHRFFGHTDGEDANQVPPLPVMPLAMTLELMAEAAEALTQMQVIGIRNVQTMRWLPFDTPSRRLRIEVEVNHEGEIDAVVSEADREGSAGGVAKGTIIVAASHSRLGPATLSIDAPVTSRWKPADIYGKSLFHGPAFQAIQSVERASPGGVEATLIDPPTPLSESKLTLPVALIDAAGQVPGLQIVGLPQLGDERASLIFPNSIGELWYTPGPHAGKLRVVAAIRSAGEMVTSDVEMINEQGEVVLRVLGRVDQLVKMPGGLYTHWPNPTQITFSRSRADLFAIVPLIDACTIVEPVQAADTFFVNRLWQTALSRMVLSREELKSFHANNLAPVDALGWLLERIAVKDAVRIELHKSSDVNTLTLLPWEIEISSSAVEPQAVTVRGGMGPSICTARHRFRTMVATTSDARVASVGVSLQPLSKIADETLTVTYSAKILKQLMDVLPGSSISIEDAVRIGFCATQAAARALGLSDQVAMRELLIQSCDASRRSLLLRFKGSSDTPDTPSAGRVEVYFAIEGDYVFGVCVRSR